jgi:hypothetical protein
MNWRTSIILLCVAAMFGGCQSATQPTTVSEPVEFIRGCWIERKDHTARFLRLLPLDDSSTYSGLISGGEEPTLHYSFDQNGSLARESVIFSLEHPDRIAGSATALYERVVGRTGAGGEQMAVYRRIDRHAEKLTVRTMNDHLRISKIAGLFRFEHIIFDGVRDGCD